MAAISRSIYEELTIESNDQKKTVDARQGVTSIDYYEDIFSPTITAKINVTNTGDTIPGSDNQGNADGYKQSIYNGLPLRGGERVALKIRGNCDKNPGLDFSGSSRKYLYVSSITNVISESQKESFTLNLVSREAITNETSRVGKKYNTNSTIDASVQDILRNYLKTDNVGTIDKSSNKYGFIGNLRKPFTVLVWLASKGVPDTSGDATAGFVFFQTIDGFQFRSIDKLIQQDPRKDLKGNPAVYTYTRVNKSGNDRDNDYNILNYRTEKNQNLLEKLRMGAYSSYRIFYNPLDFTFTDPGKGTFTIDDYSSGVKNLGQELVLPKISSSDGRDLGHIPTRFITQCIDIGTLDQDVSTDQNADPIKYQSQAIMRYNLLFTQTVTMVIPSNTNLRAGDIINCQVPKISTGDKEEFDKDQSGLYMIKELCHHFDTDGSYTSMKLVRDTFGKHGANNK
jgi:hypothetical protein